MAIFLVATPIGNLSDMSPRAIAVLKNAQVIYAEDTRHSAKLKRHFAISGKILSFHDFNESKRINEIIAVAHSQDVAIISDAGTPLIADPGFKLVRRAHTLNIKVIPIPGPTALVAGLISSGIPADRFVFEGFLPAKKQALRELLTRLKTQTRTMVFYESPTRVAAALKEMRDIFGTARLCSVAREISKIHESIITDSLANIYALYATGDEPARGELVLTVAGFDGKVNEEKIIKMLEIYRRENIPLKQAVRMCASLTDLSRNAIYKQALNIWKA